jgi:hypothetical protein
MNMNTTLHAEQPMNTTILNYPGFQTLPKGVRQMLLVSEAYFFNEPASHHHSRDMIKAVRKPGSAGIRSLRNACGWHLLLAPQTAIETSCNRASYKPDFLPERHSILPPFQRE